MRQIGKAQEDLIASAFGLVHRPIQEANAFPELAGVGLAEISIFRLPLCDESTDFL
jgi:hypothetical protein